MYSHSFYKMINLIMNLINETHHSYKKKTIYLFIIKLLNNQLSRSELSRSG